jgi:hypothetical protein
MNRKQRNALKMKKRLEDRMLPKTIAAGCITGAMIADMHPIISINKIILRPKAIVRRQMV